MLENHGNNNHEDSHVLGFAAEKKREQRHAAGDVQ